MLFPEVPLSRNFSFIAQGYLRVLFRGNSFALCAEPLAMFSGRLYIEYRRKLNYLVKWTAAAIYAATFVTAPCRFRRVTGEDGSSRYVDLIRSSCRCNPEDKRQRNGKQFLQKKTTTAMNTQMQWMPKRASRCTLHFVIRVLLLLLALYLYRAAAILAIRNV